MSRLELKVYEIFKSKLGTEEAETVIEYFEVKTEEKYPAKRELLVTKEDLSATKIELLREISQSKFDMIKWMVGFWLTQMAVLLGLYLRS